MSLALRLCLCRPRVSLLFPRRYFNDAATNSLFRNQAKLDVIRMKDRLPPDYRLIYRAPLGLYFAFSQGLTYVSLFLMGALAVERYFPEYFPSFGEKDPNHATFEAKVSGLVGSPTEVAIMLTVYAAMCLSVMRLMWRYPIRIYRRGDSEYRALFYGLIPGTKRRIIMQAGQVKKEKSGGILPWQQSLYRTTQGHKLVVIEQYFQSPAEYNRLMGYDKLEGDK